jgi:C_GCAxxG_C_C family probable redox protein
VSRASDAAALVAQSKLNCAQAVLAAFAAELGLPRITALQIAQGFGGGMGRTGGVCGAVSGACMVLGLRPSTAGMDSPEQRDELYRKIQGFKAQFETMHGSVMCPTLLGYDLSQPGERAAARASGVVQSVCPKLVEDAVTMLEALA